jgi:hypothetical protein
MQKFIKLIAMKPRSCKGVANRTYLNYKETACVARLRNPMNKTSLEITTSPDFPAPQRGQ